MNDGRYLGCEDLLGLVELDTLKLGQADDFAQRQLGEETQEFRHIRIRRVAPELPEPEGRQVFRMQPDRTGSGLAHLGSACGRDQRNGQAEELAAIPAAAQFDPVDDVAPLV